MTSLTEELFPPNETINRNLFLDPFPYLTNPFELLNQQQEQNKLKQNDSNILDDNNSTLILSGDCLSIKDIMEGLLFNDLVLYACLSLTSLVTALVASKTVYIYQKQLNHIAKKIRTNLEDLFLVLFTAFWLIVVHNPYGCCVIWRGIVTLYMKAKYGALGDIATGLDSSGSVDTPQSRQIIKCLKVLKGVCDINEFRKRVSKTACKSDPKTGELVHPKFHQYMDTCGGFYCWKPAQFDINHHVRFMDGFDEKSESLSETQVLDLVSKKSNLPFDKNRGYWEILVIPKFHYDWEDSKPEKEREAKFSILVRISHGIGDGFSFLKLVMRDMAGEDAGEYVPPTNKKNKSSWFYKVFVFFYVLLKSPRAFYSEMGLKDVNPLHNPNIKMTGEKVHVWSQPISMEWLKLLKKQLGYGMSTILLETLSGACRRYMTQQLGLPESELPKTIHAIIPVPAPNHPNNKMVNKFSIVMMPLEIKSGNVSDRCRLTEGHARVMARSPDSYMNLFLMDLVSPFPVSLAKWFIINTQCTTVISNLPGPSKTVSIWGYPLVDTMFWLPNVGSSGISVSYLSYENKMRIGLVVDTGVIPDGINGAQKLQDWMIEDLRALATSANVPLDDMFIKMDTDEGICIDSDMSLKINEDMIEEDPSSDHSVDEEQTTSGVSSDNDEDSAIVQKNHKNGVFNGKLKCISLETLDDNDKRFLMTQSVTGQCVNCVNKNRLNCQQNSSHRLCSQSGRS